MFTPKYIVLAIFLTYSLGYSAELTLAQKGGKMKSDVGSQMAQTQSEEERKQLRVKACGTNSVNYTARTDKTQHPMPDAPADKALVYVIRSTMLGFKIHSKLAVDGKWMGVNRGDTYFFFTLKPGEHYFCSESENQSYLALAVEPGKTYYLQQKVKPGIWKARTELVVMTEKEAKAKLAKVDLSTFELKP